MLYKSTYQLCSLISIHNNIYCDGKRLQQILFINDYILLVVSFCHNSSLSLHSAVLVGRVSVFYTICKSLLYRLNKREVVKYDLKRVIKSESAQRGYQEK